MTERWLPIVGYEVSNLGRVRSWRRNKRVGRIMKAVPNSGGYFCVGLYAGSRKMTTSVSVLVAQSFIGSRPAGLVVRHLDGDKSNNDLMNLAYGTPAENIHDQMVHGTHRQTSKTHCPRDHPLIDGNLVKRTNGKRECATCNRERVRRYHHRPQEAKLANV